MFQSIVSFFELIDVNPRWGVLIIVLALLRGMLPYEKVAKIEEVKNKNGDTSYHIYRIK